MNLNDLNLLWAIAVEQLKPSCQGDGPGLLFLEAQGQWRSDEFHEPCLRNMTRMMTMRRTEPQKVRSLPGNIFEEYFIRFWLEEEVEYLQNDKVFA